MKKFMCVLISFIILIGSAVGIPASAISMGEENVVFDSPEAMAEYIQNNLDDFADEYNQENATMTAYSRMAVGAEIFDPDYCENQFSVQLANSTEYVICMDFNESNGYMIVSKDSILKLTTLGDLDYLYAYEGEVYFSIIDDDFVYYQDGEYFLFGNDDERVITPVNTYNGTDSDGVITSRGEYIRDRYPDAELDSGDLIPTNYLSLIDQEECSVYFRNGFTEGNCAPVAILNALTIMRNKGTYSSLPAASTINTIIPENDYFYQAAIDNNYTVRHRTLPALYNQIRQLAIMSYGYTVSNGQQPNGSSSSSAINSDTTVDFLETMGTFYNLDINAKKKNLTMSNVSNQIYENKPIIWYLVDDATYGDHAVVITGYYTYKQYKTVLGIKVCTNTINLLRLADGWNDISVYYDLESTSGKIFVFN